MAIKLVVAVLMYLAIAQETSSQFADSCYTQTQQLRTEISLAAQSSDREIPLARVDIKRNIGQVRSDIQIQAKNLRIKADLAGAGTASCRRQLDLDLAYLNDQALNLCYYDLKLNLLSRQVDQINNLKGTANQICSLCAHEASCVDTKIQEIQKQAADLHGSISAGVGGVREDSNKCVEGAQNSQLEVLKKASDNLDACLGSA